MWGAGFRVQGSGSRVQGSGFRVEGIRYKVQGVGSGVYSLRLRFGARCLVFGDQGSGFHGKFERP
jgi:hypothetical protein